MLRFLDIADIPYNEMTETSANSGLRPDDWNLIFFSFLFLINIISFCVYAYDKHLAVGHFMRVPEIVLHLLSILGGAYGSGMAMLLCRHKTRHLSFQIIVPIFFFVWTAVFIFFYYKYVIK